MSEHLEVWYGQRKFGSPCRASRGATRSGDYRHVIDWLVWQAWGLRQITVIRRKPVPPAACFAWRMIGLQRQYAGSARQAVPEDSWSWRPENEALVEAAISHLVRPWIRP